MLETAELYTGWCYWCWVLPSFTKAIPNEFLPCSGHWTQRIQWQGAISMPSWNTANEPPGVAASLLSVEEVTGSDGLVWSWPGKSCSWTGSGRKLCGCHRWGNMVIQVRKKWASYLGLEKELGWWDSVPSLFHFFTQHLLFCQEQLLGSLCLWSRWRISKPISEVSIRSDPQ